jgi:hypothetical protein
VAVCKPGASDTEAVCFVHRCVGYLRTEAETEQPAHAMVRGTVMTHGGSAGTASCAHVVSRRAVDDAPALLVAGYGYTRKHRHSAGFRTRVLGRVTTVVGGRDGVQLFYDETRTQRRRAMRMALKNTLFGRGAVHGLDGDEHPWTFVPQGGGDSRDGHRCPGKRGMLLRRTADAVRLNTDR